MLITEILDKWPQRTLTYVVYFFQFPLYLLPRCQVWKSRLVLTTCRAWVPLISRGSPLMLAGPEQRIWGWEAAGLTGGLVAHPIIASKGLFTDLCLLLFWVLVHCFFFFFFNFVLLPKVSFLLYLTSLWILVYLQWRLWRLYKRGIPMEKTNKRNITRRLLETKDFKPGQELHGVWKQLWFMVLFRSPIWLPMQ